MIKRLVKKFSSQKYEEFYYCIEEFSEGLKLISSNQLDLAENMFKVCIEKTEKKQFLGESPHNTILRYLALVQRSMGKFQECENSLEQIANNLHHKNSPDKYNAFMNLIRQTLHSNIPKALSVSRVHKSSIPAEYKPEYNFLYGTALVLNDYFDEGKKCLTESLTEEQSINNAYVLHNLACGQWWHAKMIGNEEVEDSNKILEDFKQAIPNFTKSIKISEGLDHDFNPEKDQIMNEGSSLSALNIAEIFLQAGVLPHAIKWTKSTLNQGISKQFHTNGKAFTLLGISIKKTLDVENAEKCFQTALNFLKSSENFDHFITLTAYENLIRPSKPLEADELKLKSEKILSKLFPWSEKSSQALLPTWHL